MAIPPFMAPADINTSGTNSIPSLKSIPTMRIPSTNALVRISYGAHPRSNRILTASSISFLKGHRISRHAFVRQGLHRSIRRGLYLLRRSLVFSQTKRRTLHQFY